MKPINRTQFERLRHDVARLNTALQAEDAWHAIGVLNTSTGNTTSAPNPDSEGASSDHSDPTARTANTFDPQLLQDHAALATLHRLATDAIRGADSIMARSSKPRAAKCPNCSIGEIPVGITRCNNEKCNSHGSTVIECANGCGQRLITGTVGKTKPHKVDGIDGPVCRDAYRAEKRNEKYKRERGSGKVDVMDTAGQVTA